MPHVPPLKGDLDTSCFDQCARHPPPRPSPPASRCPPPRPPHAPPATFPRTQVPRGGQLQVGQVQRPAVRRAVEAGVWVSQGRRLSGPSTCHAATLNAPSTRAGFRRQTKVVILLSFLVGGPHQPAPRRRPPPPAPSRVHAHNKSLEYAARMSLVSPSRNPCGDCPAACAQQASAVVDVLPMCSLVCDL